MDGGSPHCILAQRSYIFGSARSYSANGNGIVNGSGAQFASVVAGAPLYAHRAIAGVTQPGTIQWLNPDAFVSPVDPSTGACTGGDSIANCQFGDLGRNTVRGPDSTIRISAPVLGYAGVPGKPSTQTGFGALTYTTSPPTRLLGVGLGGDCSLRMITFQARLEF